MNTPIQDRILVQKLKYTKLYLKRNKNLFFTVADKGNITVAMEKAVYVKGMEDLLSDKNTYMIINKNHLFSLQKSTHRLIKQWNDYDYLNKKYHNREITQTDTILPRLIKHIK